MMNNTTTSTTGYWYYVPPYGGYCDCDICPHCGKPRKKHNNYPYYFTTQPEVTCENKQD